MAAGGKHPTGMNTCFIRTVETVVMLKLLKADRYIPVLGCGTLSSVRWDFNFIYTRTKI